MSQERHRPPLKPSLWFCIVQFLGRHYAGVVATDGAGTTVSKELPWSLLEEVEKDQQIPLCQPSLAPWAAGDGVVLLELL